MCWGASKITSRGAGPGRLEIRAVVGAWTTLSEEGGLGGLVCSIVIAAKFISKIKFTFGMDG